MMCPNIDIKTEIKNIITYFYGSTKLFIHLHSKEELLTWLEKQAEQKPVELPKVNPENLREELDKAIKIYKPDGRSFGWVTLYNIACHFFELGLKANKVEPKFKVGDWIVCCDYEPVQIIGIRTNAYEMSNGDIRPFYMIDNNHNVRLWTIQDAKDGDVLFQDLMCGKTFIYNGINSDMAILYSFIISNDGEDVLPYHIGKPNTGIGNIEENKNIIHPATKEQRDMLFQKMKEAGYEWDAERKGLKKINDKFDFSRMKVFTPVLARTGDNQIWLPHFFESYHPQNHGGEFYMIDCQHTYSQCVPFEGNEKLFRTQDPIPPFYNIR